MKQRLSTEHIVLHCADTPPTADIGAKEIREWHKDRGWSDIGYHYVVRRNGSVEEGRPEYLQGAHVKGLNHCALGICLVGGGAGRFDFTRKQLKSTERLINVLLCKYKKAVVRGHNDFDGVKTCPNFDVKQWWYSE